MARNPDKKQINTNLSPEMVEELKSKTKELGISQNQAVNQAIKLWMADTLKQRAPGQAEMIDSYEYHLGCLLDSFRVAVEASISASEKAREEVRGELQGMAALASANEQLQKQITTLASERDALAAKLEDAELQNSELRKHITESAASEREATELRERVAALQTELAAVKIEMAETIQSLQTKRIEDLLGLIKKE